MRQISDQHFRQQYRPALVTHLGGGQHLDAIGVDPGLRAHVANGDAAQYGDGGWASLDLLLRDACPAPTEDAPATDRAYWLDDRLSAGEQWAAHRFLAGSADHPGPVLQVGGRGTDLVRWMRATGRAGILLAPFDAELDHCRALARSAGVVDRLVTVRAPAEVMPMATGVMGTAVAPGVLHHTDLGASTRELVRVVATDGRFATWDVYCSPAYRLGIWLFGKQEAIRCHPLTAARLAELPQHAEVEVSWGGCVMRYPVALLSRLGLPLRPVDTVRWGLVDRWLCRRAPFLRAVSASTVSLHGRGSATVILPRERAAVDVRVDAQAPGRPSAR